MVLLSIPYLNINGVWICSSFEKITSGPANRFSGIRQFTFHHPTELKNTPRKHGGGEGHGKAKLDVVPCIVVPSNQINMHGRAIGETRVPPPRHPLVRGELP
uniref:Uncharacterized protein n=1 Tax=Lotus japonicus TaxID=34305 RepID=I3SPX5_LOTJA|nr:unknown [Lotus japonicus]